MEEIQTIVLSLSCPYTVTFVIANAFPGRSTVMWYRSGIALPRRSLAFSLLFGGFRAASDALNTLAKSFAIGDVAA